MEALTVKKHIFIEKESKKVHVITFDTPVFGNTNLILSHAFVQTLINGNNYLVHPTSDLNTIRLSVYTNFSSEIQ